MSDYREESNHCKAVRSGIVEQRPVSKRIGKRKKPVTGWIVESRWIGRMGELISDWKKYRCYGIKDIAEQFISKQTQKHAGFMEYRLKEPTP